LRVKEYSAISTKVIATCFALIGFAGCLLVGAVAGNSTVTILYRSLVGFVICYILGGIVAHVGQRAVRQSIEQYKQENPIADEYTNEGDREPSSAVGTIEQESEPVSTSRSAA